MRAVPSCIHLQTISETRKSLHATQQFRIRMYANIPFAQYDRGFFIPTLNLLRTLWLEGKFIFVVRLSENFHNSLFQMNQQ